MLWNIPFPKLQLGSDISAFIAKDILTIVIEMSINLVRKLILKPCNNI